ncbi:TrmH family RNA methyltransferase [Deinococcus cellulosilyticus]|uniref:rRNA methyltransferase n=1 Tax=Deinococcus cellulosilyticus (strain DSM 18568 / NBRC 106333 / KACC 11606 / 5516J-15) TaxID=1223518 RepID=A0A511NB80_DEIC1|nr:RNA methyltransferase [Deinococcus cellulosilyticus]GEM49816.1 rRNA methyltransferase [Deinococcus cellulosilyticus NBRC 106333 = KACC 11606]
MKEITSTQNPELKTLVKLHDRRHRRKEGKFLIEGAREASRALLAGVEVEKLYFCEGFFSPEALELYQDFDAVEQVRLSRPAFEKISLRENPDGILALAVLPEFDLQELHLSEQALVLVLQGLEKPGNLGALLRTADGVGVDAVFITGEGTDLYNPNVIRASQGSVFTQPVHAVQDEELLDFLKQSSFTILAATPHTQKTYWEADYSGPTAICLGTEHEGLSEFWMHQATEQVVIPMQGTADSLNVGIAGALLLYEALRQRKH